MTIVYDRSPARLARSSARPSNRAKLFNIFSSIEGKQDKILRTHIRASAPMCTTIASYYLVWSAQLRAASAKRTRVGRQIAFSQVLGVRQRPIARRRLAGLLRILVLVVVLFRNAVAFPLGLLEVVGC